jgi:enamine deaminase RidA (YjgF/YER057c/UK114 family)
LRTIYRNLFDGDRDRAEIWEMLVERDIRAFAAGDWNQVADDFLPDNFLAVDGRMRSNPDSWSLGFATLEKYRTSWLEQSEAMRDLAIDLEQGLYEATILRDIEIQADRALAHKKFDGQIRRSDGIVSQLRWQTLYLCRKITDTWKIAGFVGYLPHPFGVAELSAPDKQLPASVAQHATAGPYSPVLTVRTNRFVVISGQAAVAADGSVIGDTIEDQTRAALDNCTKQLAAAGCRLRDVFKVNAYLADLGMWEAFNAVYQEVIPAPLPVRTTVGVRLLGEFLVELEMWAVKQ